MCRYRTVISQTRKCNPFLSQASGYYRVNYDIFGWSRLASVLQDDHLTIPELNRAQLINDAFAMASVDKVNYSVALNMTLYLTEEDEYVPIKARNHFIRRPQKEVDLQG